MREGIASRSERKALLPGKNELGNQVRGLSFFEKKKKKGQLGEKVAILSGRAAKIGSGKSQS